MPSLLSSMIAFAQISQIAVPAQLQVEIKRHWSADLKDAPSARWLWPKQRDDQLYCGWFNAKNSFGGYTGWTSYVVILEKGAVKRSYLLPRDPEMARALGANCVTAGYEVEQPPL